jgi:hypothetical protein
LASDPEGSIEILWISSRVKLLSVLPVILLVDKWNELPTDTKNCTSVVGDETNNFIEVVESFVILAYCKLLVVKVPAPGLAPKLNIDVWEPEGQFITLLST